MKKKTKMILELSVVFQFCLLSYKSNNESYIIYKRIILYLQIKAFVKLRPECTISPKFVLNKHQIYL